MTFIKKSESVGVFSPSSLFPQDIGKNWKDLGVISASIIRTSSYLGNGIAIIGDTGGHAFRSTDYGATWTDLGVISALSIYTSSYLGNGIAIMGGDGGHVFRSTDYGLTWTDLGVISLSVFLASSYFGNGIAIICDNSGHIFRSTDYGATWTDLGVILSQIRTSSYLENGIAIIGNFGGHVFRSTDYGATWTDLGVISPYTGAAIYASSYLGNGIAIIGDATTSDGGHVFRSTDYGATWTNLGAILTSVVYSSSYLGNGIVIIGGTSGAAGHIFRSTDYGLTWSDLGVISTVAIRTSLYIGNGIIIISDGGVGSHVFRSDISYKTDERASNFPVPYSQLKINDSILTSDILSTEFNVANKLLKLDAGAFTPTAQLGSGAAGATTFLRGDQSWQVPGGGAALYDISRYRRVGATADRWYTIPNLAIAVKLQLANKLIAMPIVVPVNITLDNIAIKVTTLAAGNARLGIYNDDGNMYPNALVLDAGTVDTSTTGVKTISINQALTGNNLYWLVVVFNATPTVNGFSSGSGLPGLGNDNTLPLPTTDTPAIGWVADFAYDVLPATFPAGATAYGTIGTAAYLYPAIYFRMSA